MSIQKRSNGTYLVRWRERPGAPEKSKAFAKKRDAENFETTTKAAIQTGTFVDPNAGKVRFATYAADWAKVQPWRPSTRETHELTIDKRLVPKFGESELRSIRTSDVQAWVSGLVADQLAPRTVSQYFKLLKAIMRAAVNDRLIVHSPCINVRLPKIDRRGAPLVPLTLEQVRALADGVPEHLRALTLVSAGLGLRSGEARALTVDRIDFLRRHVVINRQLLRLPKGETEFGPTKTDASNRVVTLPDSVAVELAEHIRRFPPQADGLLFRLTDGRPVTDSAWGSVFRDVARKLGIKATPHDLRHHAASALIAAGCSVKSVQLFLGHATAAETLNTYSHLWPGDEDRIRAAIDNLWAADRLRTAAG